MDRAGKTQNLWQTTCAEPFEAPALAEDIAADLIVIGGGFTGCSAALTAAQSGMSVVLIEAETVGHGGSGRNVGLVNAGLWLPPDAVCDELGQEAGTRLNTALAKGPDTVFDLIEEHGIECEPVRGGTLHCAHAPGGFSELQERHRQQAERGAPVRLLDGEEARSHSGITGIHGALHDARAGTIQPLAYAKGLARAAQEAGARVFENTRAMRIARDADQWRVEAAGGTLTAPRLLVATNAYHQPFEGAELPTLTPVNFFQLATAPLGHNQAARILPGGEGCWDTGKVMSAFRTDRAGRVIFGAMGLPDALGLHEAWARRAFSRRFPDVAEHPFEHFWSGRIAMTSDHLPKIMRIGQGGYAIFGYSGRGIGPGTLFGDAIARALMSGDEGGLPIAPVNSHKERLTWAKGPFFEVAARLIHGVSARLR
ncbi:MAG: FAD-binding oxidoreductase [Sediminimonas qiaohouensis]|uniref:FAD-binding oxidoreductase n=1 Tax=Sediminimonas qiaohouensis TaxID=552061 RepID=A0A7C9L883_9RHOB|nr:FAD-dependent oxidoreductase [Sediminimonas qiaohouensis]MTJ04414.1 FAD-binding oxidoreductase [Sediminimonas qiaohouensis]